MPQALRACFFLAWACGPRHHEPHTKTPGRLFGSSKAPPPPVCFVAATAPLLLPLLCLVIFVAETALADGSMGTLVTYVPGLEGRDENWCEWRIRKTQEFGTWVGSDEMALAIRFFRWWMKGFKVFYPTEWEGTCLKSYANPTSSRNAIVTILVDAHWIRVEAYRRGEQLWELYWTGATQKEVDRLLPHVLPLLEGSCHAQTLWGHTDILTQKHLCGFRVLQRWSELGGMHLPPVGDFAAQARALCPAYEELLCSANTAFIQKIDQCTPDVALRATATSIAFRQRYLLSLIHERAERSFCVGGALTPEEGG